MNPIDSFSYYTENKSIRQAVYEALRDSIVCGEIPAGQRLTEMEYAEKFNVSRTPIRAAFQKLVQNGLVESSSAGKIIAKGFSLSSINKLFNLQNSLESLALPWVLENITDEDMQYLNDLLINVHKSISLGNITQAAYNNESFHKQLFAISRFEGIMEAVDLAYGYVQGFNLLAFHDIDRQQAITSEHQAILKAIEQKNFPLLESVSRYHTEACRFYCIRKYEENTSIQLQKVQNEQDPNHYFSGGTLYYE